MKEEALKLAEERANNPYLDPEANAQDFKRLADMIRKLVAELDKQKQTIRNLEKSLGFKNSGYETINLTPQTKPLSDEEIMNVVGELNLFDIKTMVKAIERAHGIS